MTFTNRWFALGVLSSALLMIVIDMTVLYTALPVVTKQLNATAAEKLWIVNIYALVVAGLLPTTGALSDRFGGQRMMVVGLAIFGMASACAAFAPTSSALVIARVVLAVGAAAMMPATLSMIRAIFDADKERSLAVGIWAAVASGGAALGPVIGGILLEYFWWGSVFLINLPIVMLALACSVLFLPKSRSDKTRRIDPWSAMMVMVGLVSITYAIKNLAGGGSSRALASILVVVGTVVLWGFFRRQMAAQNPLIDFALFRQRTFCVAVAAALTGSATIFGVEFTISQQLQLVRGLTPFQAGLAILPVPLAAFVAGRLAGFFLPRIGAGRLLCISLATSGLGVFLLLGLMHKDVWFFVLALATIGAGLGGTTTAASSTIISAAPADKAGAAASIEEVSFELGSSLGITFFGSVLAIMYTRAFSGVLSRFPESAGSSFESAWQLATRTGREEGKTIMRAAVQAFDAAAAITILVIAATISLVALGVLGLISRR